MAGETKTLGILGGGQLGRMTALAAARLGIQVHIYTPEEDSPAAQVSAHRFTGAYDDRKKLRAFAESVDVVTYEFENIPVESVRYIQKYRPVFPDDRLLEIAQDRVTEKQFLNDIGIATAQWGVARGAHEVELSTSALPGSDFILKTTRFGYDGKGQTGYRKGEDSRAKWRSLNSREIIVEEKVDFVCEISVIIARDKLGQTALYGPVLNEHKNHILSRSVVPAPVPGHLAEEARKMTLLLAEAVDLVGVLALEMFITRDGRVLANEIAPRPHNSGHWSIDACCVSQFEQHVRTVCGLPVGLPGRKSDAVMINLLGEDIGKMGKYYEMANACVHLYGKKEARPGRKMGHVTILSFEERKAKKSGEPRKKALPGDAG